ncbi:MAG: lysozyme inhibitor LprI family protein [Pseudomonadota bacterium]
MYFIFILTLFLLISSPASAQIDCAKEERRIDVLNCVETEYDRVEGNMRKTYMQAIYRLNEDKDTKRMEMLRESQQAWEDYRYKACDAQVVEKSGLSEDFKLKTRLCHKELANRRQKDIFDHFKTWDYVPDHEKTRNSALLESKKKKVNPEEVPEPQE